MPRDEAGFSLVEIVIATLALAIIATGLVGASTIAARARVKDDSRVAATHAADALRSVLRDYVISWPSTAEPPEADLAVLDSALLGLAGCTNTCRRLPGDTCPWALSLSCDHQGAALLPAALAAPPRNFALRYDVTRESDGSRTIAIHTTWQE